MGDRRTPVRRAAMCMRAAPRTRRLTRCGARGVPRLRSPTRPSAGSLTRSQPQTVSCRDTDPRFSPTRRGYCLKTVLLEKAALLRLDAERLRFAGCLDCSRVRPGNNRPLLSSNKASRACTPGTGLSRAYLRSSSPSRRRVSPLPIGSASVHSFAGFGYQSFIGS